MADTVDPSSGLRAFQIVLIVLTTTAVILRFWSRALLPALSDGPMGARVSRFWWDDWFALMSLPLSIFGNVIAIYITEIMMDSSQTGPDPTQIKVMMKVSLAAFFIWDMAITFPKISVLFFYTRVFGSAGREFRYALWIAFGLVLAWLFAMCFVTIFTCNPPSKWWNPDGPGACMAPSTPWLAAIIPQTIIDLYVLILPLPMLWKLQLKPKRKFWVSCVFVCGYCVVLISIARLLLYSINPSALLEAISARMTPTSIACVYLLFSQPAISIISICLPNIFQLVRRGIELGPSSLFNSRTLYGLSRLPAADGTDIAKSRRGTWQSTRDPIEQGLVPGGVNTMYHVSAEEASATSLRGSDVDAIYVINEVSVSNETKQEKSMI